MYADRHYVTITGHKLPGAPSTINECNGTLHDLHRAVFGEPDPRKNRKRASTTEKNPAGNSTTGKQPTDKEVTDKAASAGNGEKFLRLMDGDASGYTSTSEADSALAHILAFWSRDTDQIQRIMRTSKLCRDKWDRDDYLPGTVGKALENVTEFYSWTPQEPLNAIYLGEDEEGKPIFIPRPMPEVKQHIVTMLKGWPRRQGTALFIHDGGPQVHWIENRAALFGYVATKLGTFSWKQGDRFVGQELVFQEFRRTAQEHMGVESVPHYPPIDGLYYTCNTPPAGDGSTLNGLIDFFCLATPLDRQLLLAAFATPMWGGPSGTRPALMITCLAGRGRGKTKLAELVARIFGGTIDIAANEDAGKIKERLLSPQAKSKRIALLDNVKATRFSWAELGALITCDTVSGKELYVGEGRRPNTLTWIITLNGANLSTDLAQRVIELRLREPVYDGGWEEKVKAYIDFHCEAIIGDIIGFLQRPKKQLRRFTRWATWEAEVLSRVDNPDQCLDLIVDPRGAVDVEQEEGEVIEDYFAQKLEWLDYDPERDDVFIPNDMAARWYNAATGDTKKVTGVTRSLKQLHDEGRAHRIVPSRSGDRTARGFRWVGAHADVVDVTYYNIRIRLAEKMKEQPARGTTHTG